MPNKHIRVYELAKELNKTSKEIMAVLAEKNIEVTTHMATLEDNQAELVRGAVGSGQQEAKKEGAAPAKKKKFVVVHNPENSRDRKSPERRPAQPKTQAAKPVQKPVQKPAAAPKAAPKAPAAAPAAAAPAASAGSIEVTASVPGKVFKVEASAGQAVKAGDPIVILEAMKMEIPVVAPEDGTVAGINVSVGDAVESGDVLATMN